MYKKISIIFSFIFLFSACDSIDKPAKPENLIAKEKMSDILYDLYIINAAKGVNRKILETNGFIPETYILTKYNIDSLQFVNSNAYYAYDPKDYESIIERVKSRIENKKTTLESLQKKEGMSAKRKRDSIAMVKAKVRDSLIKNTKKGTKI
ncbi:MAG: DUF4296 domain-containing protein [Winogradskyella sp.]|uniref:DUF4296 domain-containing protein n=1 Tax=Winogradskyella sp. TaxID=1883156 RepID=UPI0017D27EC0|nr:DUF4296 domain-containing protein [Winogradskyella sp.]